MTGSRENRALVPASKVLAMATGMGALVLGRPDLGRLKVGARADIVLLNNTGAHWYPKEIWFPPSSTAATPRMWIQ